MLGKEKNHKFYHGGPNLRLCFFWRDFRRLHNFFSIGGTAIIFFTKIPPCSRLHEKVIGVMKFGRIGHIRARARKIGRIFFQFFSQKFLIFIENIKKCFFSCFKAEKHPKNNSEKFWGRQKFLHDFGQIDPQPFFFTTQILNFQMVVIFVIIDIFS